MLEVDMSTRFEEFVDKELPMKKWSRGYDTYEESEVRRAKSIKDEQSELKDENQKLRADINSLKTTLKYSRNQIKSLQKLHENDFSVITMDEILRKIADGVENPQQLANDYVQKQDEKDLDEFGCGLFS